MSEDIVIQLIDISNKKLVLLNKLLELTKFQKTSINNSDMNKLDNILDQKDELIKSIDDLDIKFLTCFSELKSVNNVENLDELDSKDIPSLKKLKEVIGEITSTLMAISMLDKENTKVIKEELEEIKASLKTVKKGQRAYSGYNKVLNKNIMIDEKK